MSADSSIAIKTDGMMNEVGLWYHNKFATAHLLGYDAA